MSTAISNDPRTDLAERVRQLESELAAERAARRAFEENVHDVLAILAHDLRNPLGTVLTTARLMVKRTELSPEVKKRIERVVASGVRMLRMIEQMTDTTNAEVALVRDQEHDVADVVRAIVGEASAVHPTRPVEVRVEGECRALLDRDRVAQVLRTLVCNALVHGAVDRPVRVTLERRPTAVVVEVHNDGPTIDDPLRASLFDARRPKHIASGPSEGLGLGLHIAERVAAAHGGRLELVVSSVEAGTLFRLTLPRR